MKQTKKKKKKKVRIKTDHSSSNKAMQKSLKSVMQLLSVEKQFTAKIENFCEKIQLRPRSHSSSLY